MTIYSVLSDKLCLLFHWSSSMLIICWYSMELSPLFLIWRYTFSTCQHSEVNRQDNKLYFETNFILSNDGCIFEVWYRVHQPEYQAWMQLLKQEYASNCCSVRTENFGTRDNLLGITQQASWCRTVTLVTECLIRISYNPEGGENRGKLCLVYKKRKSWYQKTFIDQTSRRFSFFALFLPILFIFFQFFFSLLPPLFSLLPQLLSPVQTYRQQTAYLSVGCMAQ